ncbi:MAG: FAD-dependent oxidoreductase [Pseudomonadota bacterium]
MRKSPEYLSDPGQVYDVAIVGAGPTGSSLALAAVKAGLSVALIDGRPAVGSAPLKRDTRNFAIVRGSWRLLTRLGVTETLTTDAEPLLGLEAEDGSGHILGAPAALFGTDDLDATDDEIPLGYMVQAEPLQAALDAAVNAKAASEGLAVMRPTRFAGYTVEGETAIVSLEDDTPIRTRLLVGCDGVNSPVRAAAGIGTEGRDYGKSVFAANVKLSHPHGGIARQLFMPEGPFATLPLPGDRANLAWYLKRGAAEVLAECSTEEQEAELNARFADFAGEMKIDGPVLAYPLKLIIAQDMVGSRVALVGDAARRINPLAGQGLNLGFKDVAALAEVMADMVRAGLDPGSAIALERYSRWRRWDATITALGMDAIDRVFSNGNPLLKAGRSLALMAADRLGGVRSALTKQASADQPGLPELMR